MFNYIKEKIYEGKKYFRRALKTRWYLKRIKAKSKDYIIDDNLVVHFKDGSILQYVER